MPLIYNQTINKQNESIRSNKNQQKEVQSKVLSSESSGIFYH
jgi:hypothetical protein